MATLLATSLSTSLSTAALLIDPFATNNNQWLQKQQVLTQLCDYANRAVTERLNEKHSLLERFEQFTFDQSFDAIFGGMLVSQNRSSSGHTVYSKPILTNLYLAEILLAADQVFYSGEFSFIANKILDYFLESTSKTEGGFIKITEYSLISGLACSFNDRDLVNLLDCDEFALLNALVEDENFSDEPYRLICYHKSLKRASEKINMHFKKAQIVEQSMTSKLIKSSDPSVTCEIVNLDNILSVNCAFVVTLCQLRLFSKREKITSTEKNLFNKTLRYMDEIDFGQKSSDYHSLIDIAFTRIVLLQINFDTNFLAVINSQHSRINRCLSRLSHSIDIGEESLYKINFINHFIDHFIEEVERAFGRKFGRKLMKIALAQTKKPNEDKENFQWVFLDKNALDLDRKIVDLHAKYDNHRFIFQIDYQLTSQLV